MVLLTLYTDWRYTRHMPKIQITLTEQQLEWVDTMAAEEARKRGADPERYRSTFIGKLIADERTRQYRREWKQEKAKGNRGHG